MSSSERQEFTPQSFIFQEQIGAGNFGIVYKAEEKNSGKVVAIKIIPKKKINSNVLHKQLQREIEIHCRLKHGNIVELYAYFQDSKQLYLVMEYCPKGSLATPIKEIKEQFSDKKIASIFCQLTHAVDYLQKRHVIHRDIKLENVLFDANYDVKITDFGWCVHTFEDRSTFCGTMEYLSPEIINKQKYGDAVDVYCIGIILYELYYEKSPFIDKDQASTFRNIQEGVIQFDGQTRFVPEEAKQLIKLILQCHKCKRPSPDQILQHSFLRKYLFEQDSHPKEIKQRNTQNVNLAGILLSSNKIKKSPEDLPFQHHQTTIQATQKPQMTIQNQESAIAAIIMKQ